jgi:hypothetical protein
MYRVTIEESRAIFPPKNEDGHTPAPIIEWTETHIAEVPNAKTMAGILRSVAEQFDPPKPPSAY